MSEEQIVCTVLIFLITCGTGVGLYAIKRHYNTLKLYVEKGYTQTILLGCGWPIWVKSKEEK